MSAKEKEDRFNSTMSLGDHLEELRLRVILALVGLVIGTAICLFFGKKIIALIQKPYNNLLIENPLITLAPPDAFVQYMKISLVSGLILSSPWVFYQLWMFVSAGLYPKEKRYVHIAIPFIVVLFITGALFFLFAVAPITLIFLLKFGEFINVVPNWTFPQYVSFITVLMLVFGIAFQTPIAILVLNKTGLVSIKALCKSRKYVLLGVFVLAAIATPPDAISQVMLAMPLYLLFELGIILSRFSNRKSDLKGT